MPSERRESLANIALTAEETPPPCPFQPDRGPCRKPGGVCSIRRYRRGPTETLGEAIGEPVITCPRRFEENSLPARWLGDIVGFEASDVQVATEVGFMQGTGTAKPAGKIDMVVANSAGAGLRWFGP